VALAESCLAGRTGCQVTLPGEEFTFLFSESAARAVVAVRPGAEAEFGALCQEQDVPAAVLGATGGSVLAVTGAFAIGLPELAAAHQGTLPALFS
jgi:phosphoribosylformylglycinamidine (FGAM) synthase-like enzyme